MNQKIKHQVPSLLLLITLVGFPQISETIFTPSLPEIASAFGVSMSVTQLTMSIYFFAFAFGVFFWGRLSDRLGRRPAMLQGIVVYGIGSFLCFVSPTIEWLLLARFIQAFGASTGSVTTQTILRESYDGKQRHVLFAHISSALAFTPAIGPLIGGIVGQYFGFRVVFFVLVAMSVLVFFYAYWQLPETLATTERQTVKLWPIAKRLVTDSKVVTYAMLIGIINGILFSYYAEAPFIFTGYFKMSMMAYGFIGIVVAIASVVGAQLSKYLLGKLRPEMIILGGIVVLLIGNGVLLAIAYGSGPVWFQLSGFLVGIFVMLVGVGAALPNCLSLALVDFQDVIGSAGALFSLSYYFLVSLVTFGMSLCHNGSLLAMPFYFIGLGTLMLLLVEKYLV